MYNGAGVIMSHGIVRYLAKDELCHSLLMKLNLTVSLGGILVMTLEEMLQATSGVFRIM